MKHTYFDNIDSSIKAYLLGFIYADGHLNKNGSSVEIKVKLADKEIINKFAEELDCNTVYTGFRELNGKNYPYIRININSRYMVRSLKVFGLTNNKTFNLRFPHLDHKLISSFILGYFDGDGNLYMGNNMTTFSIACGSLLFLKRIKTYLDDYQLKIIVQGSIYVLRADKIRNVVEVMDNLYSSSVFYLTRKYDIYQTMIEKYAKIHQNKLCGINGCGSKYYAKNKCKKHYYEPKNIKLLT